MDDRIPTSHMHCPGSGPNITSWDQELVDIRKALSDLTVNRYSCLRLIKPTVQGSDSAPTEENQGVPSLRSHRECGTSEWQMDNSTFRKTHPAGDCISDDNGPERF